IQAVYSGNANVTSSTGTLLQTITPAEASTLLMSGFPSPSSAGTFGNFIVTAQDAFGNTVAGYRGTVHFQSTDNQASLPIDYTFPADDNGVHTFSAAFVTAGDQSLIVSDTLQSNLSGSASGIVITAAAPDHLLVTPSLTTTVAGAHFD